MFCKGLPPMNKSHYHLNKCSYKDTWQINYITPPLREEAGTYHDEFNTLKSHAPLITWPIAITWQLEGIISWPSPSSSPTFCFSVLKFSNNMHLDLFFNRDAFKVDFFKWTLNGPFLWRKDFHGFHNILFSEHPVYLLPFLEYLQNNFSGAEHDLLMFMSFCYRKMFMTT